ncbi:hypothetical protein C0Q70_00411 [Pomacea canaliculata]|uniref:Poly [ADP-ribose] polymerase n=1 Tax=Pomacea canaliculata TaxID=400727 RepID=A0A2T7PWL4_POMCA|nr:hypothetical protein C0Q70_00411 [Pomacea canaliculata]
MLRLKQEIEYKAVADEIPGIFQLSAEINYISDEALELLAWALDNSLFQILTLNKSEFRNIQMKTGHVTSVPEPSFVFEVLHGQTPEQKFESLLNGRKLMYAYHGSRIENFHSILHSGLANHMNKVSLFGKGIYLSSELAVSLMYSPGGQGWSESQLGPNLGCVAVCQLIDDPSVKCTVKEDDMTEPSTSKNRARASESQAGDVPERYYVVENNEMVRIKYLLVYCEPTTTHRERFDFMYSRN